MTGPNGYHKVYTITQTSSLSPTGASNRITRITDELNRQTNYLYDANGRVSKIIAPEGNSVSIVYDAAGNVTTKTTKQKPGYTPAIADLVEQIFIDLTPYYNGAGVLNCRETTLCYRPTWYRDALNRQTDFAYNARGQLTEQIDPADQNGVRRKTIHEYQEVDTGGGVMISRKTATRTCPSTLCASQTTTRIEYEYWGNTFLPSLVRNIDPATGETRVTASTYDNAGRLKSVDGPLAGTGDTQYFHYDALGRQTWEVGALAPNGLRIAKLTTYRDSDDKVTRVQMGTVTDINNPVFTAEHERVDTSYDSRRNPIRELRSSGGTNYSVTDRSFLDRGLAECAAIRMNLAALPAATATGACAAGTVGAQGRDRITRSVYDAAGQLVQLREGVGGVNEAAEATLSYTSNGKRKYVIDANGNRAELTYDGHDRQVKWIFPSATRPSGYNFSTQTTALSTAGAVNTSDYEQYGYDAAGNRTSLRKRDGSTLTYSYDNLNRMIVKIVPSRAGLTAAQTRDVYYEYDLKGLMVKARFDALTGADGVTSGYNGFGELTSRPSPWARSARPCPMATTSKASGPS